MIAKESGMKYTSLLMIISFAALSACGQVRTKVKVSRADSISIRLADYKSGSFQDKDADSAIYFADRGLKLSRRLHYPPGEALMLNRMARINERYGNLLLAAKYQKAALTIYQHLHDQPGSAEAESNLGMLEARLGKFKSGSRLIGKTLAYYEKHRNNTGVIMSYTKLGELNELSGSPKQALQYYAKAEQLNQGRPVSDDYFKLIGSIGKLNVKMGNHRQAAAYFEKGIAQSGPDKHVKAQIAFLNSAGKTWDTLGDEKKALDYHRLGLQKAKANGLHEEEARSLIGIAGVLKDQDAEQSIQHLKNALDIARSIGQKELTAEIYRSLADEYRQQSQYREAMTALEEHHRLLDSLTNVNEGHKIAVLQGSYELAESKLQIESLELANVEKTEQRNEGLLVVGAILIVFLILAWFYYKTSQLNKQLATSNVIKDKLFSIIGHDLRNPIGGIAQLLEIMEGDKLTGEEQQQMVSEMRKQANVSLNILNALLNWGEAQLKGIHIDPSIFKARDSISKNITAQQKHINDRSIVVNNNVPDDLMVYGDINHFEFIVRNLLSNAVKFSFPAGTITIAANRETNNDQVIFSVRDEGKGINPAQQKLFLKSNLDISFGTRGEKGTGIGLMLSKEFIMANKGRIWLESEEGKGTTFYFTFPKVQSY
jgi:signal transduction histidine kinase